MRELMLTGSPKRIAILGSASCSFVSTTQPNLLPLREIEDLAKMQRFEAKPIFYIGEDVGGGLCL